MSVLISPNIKRESVRMDANGDVYDPKTKQKIQMVDPPYQPTPEEVANLTNKKPEAEIIDSPPQGKVLFAGLVNVEPETLGEIKVAIKKVELYLEELKALKKQKVEEMKKELEDAE